jgi:hypothetical protein
MTVTAITNGKAVRHFARVGRDGGLGDLIADIAAMAPLLALERRQRPSGHPTRAEAPDAATRRPRRL